jgi:long-chain acyl-CoA synthetase
MIVTEGGKNVYPEEVEAAFERIDCEELCVFAAGYLRAERGALAAGGGEQLTIVVRPRKADQDAGSARLAAQIAAANLTLADFKRVSSYLIWNEEFPRTASMKIKRDELAQQVRAGAAAAALLRAG